MKYYDIVYKTPGGYIGKHIAVEASDKEEAKKSSQCLLSASTKYKPDDFVTVEINKTPIRNLPLEKKPKGITDKILYSLI